MTKDKELEQLRAENTTLCDALRRRDEELKQAIIAIGSGLERVNVLEGLIDALQERNKTLER